jgi:hypothetical protein
MRARRAARLWRNMPLRFVTPADTLIQRVAAWILQRRKERRIDKLSRFGDDESRNRIGS